MLLAAPPGGLGIVRLKSCERPVALRHSPYKRSVRKNHSVKMAPFSWNKYDAEYKDWNDIDRERKSR